MDLSYGTPFELPAVRAMRRQTDFLAAWDTVATVLTDMHRDQDWRALTTADGGPCTSLTAALQAAFARSEAAFSLYGQRFDGRPLPQPHVAAGHDHIALSCLITDLRPAPATTNQAGGPR